VTTPGDNSYSFNPPLRSEPEKVERGQSQTAGGSEVKLYVSGSYRRFQQLRSLTGDDIDIDVTVRLRNYEEQYIKESFRALADRLCEEHPLISTDKGIFGGTPHLKDLRLSVGNILADLYVYGSIQEVQKIYAPDVTEEQIKEAIAYAQDFLEEACAAR
jgi:uncharacterized protein (DUF433 family)